MTVAGKHLDAVESRDDTPLRAARVERLIALEYAIDLNQHPLQAIHVKAGQAVSQHVVAEGAVGADCSARPLMLMYDCSRAPPVSLVNYAEAIHLLTLR